MYTITEIPAWDTKVKPALLSTGSTSLKLFEEEERLKLSSNYPTANNVSVYLSSQALNEFFGKLPSKFRASSILMFTQPISSR